MQRRFLPIHNYSRMLQQTIFNLHVVCFSVKTLLAFVARKRAFSNPHALQNSVHELLGRGA